MMSITASVVSPVRSAMFLAAPSSSAPFMAAPPTSNVGNSSTNSLTSVYPVAAGYLVIPPMAAAVLSHQVFAFFRSVSQEASPCFTLSGTYPWATALASRRDLLNGLFLSAWKNHSPKLATELPKLDKPSTRSVVGSSSGVPFTVPSTSFAAVPTAVGSNLPVIVITWEVA